MNQEDKINLMKDTAREQLKHYNIKQFPKDFSNYKRQIKRDLETFESYGIKGNTQIQTPLHPSIVKYLLRDNLEKLGLNRDKVLWNLNDVFNDNMKKLPSVRSAAKFFAENIIDNFNKRTKLNILEAMDPSIILGKEVYYLKNKVQILTSELVKCKKENELYMNGPD